MTRLLALPLACLLLTGGTPPSPPIPHAHQTPADGFLPASQETSGDALYGALEIEPEPEDAEPVTEARGVLTQPVAPRRWTPDDVRAAMAGASWCAQQIVRGEVGGVGFNPYAVGAAGELGSAQLHPRGLLPDFYQRGYSDPFSPYQAVSYLEGALARGLGRHWTTAPRGCR